MWNYEKRLQYPVKITQTNPQIAKVIISQFGGPDGELAASMRYLSQRYTMPYKEVTATLTDIGTEELAHMEMICATNKYAPKAPSFRHFRVHIDCEFRVFLVFLISFRFSQNNPVNQLFQGTVLFRDSQRAPLTQ